MLTCQDKNLHQAHHVFKDKGQGLAGVDDVVEDDDVGVFEALEERS